MLSFGIDHLLELNPSWKSKPIALLTNHAAKTRWGVPSRKALIDAGFQLNLLFSPEHGLDLQGEDGKYIPDGMDPLTGLPIISLYGKKFSPDADDLAGIEILLFDIPDIGARFYTYLWSLTHLLEACAELNKKLWILDRPNPISGNLSLSEGPVLDPATASFIGRWPIPIRHSATLGEIARYFISQRKINIDLEIIPCQNWDRNSFQPDWGIPFEATSPAIQHFDSMLLYPGLCLLEATNISEGRGTDRAFRIAGAPWINGKVLTNLFNQLGLEDIKAKPTQFIPALGKYQGQTCEGIEFEILDRNCFQPVANGLLLINLIRSIYPSHFGWANYPTEANPSGSNHLDKLLGIANSEALFQLPLQQFLLQIVKITQAREWQNEIAEFLLY